jgi:hypothetical protein
LKGISLFLIYNPIKVTPKQLGDDSVLGGGDQLQVLLDKNLQREVEQKYRWKEYLCRLPACSSLVHLPYEVKGN